ncbi:related to Cytochrome c oxidase assembly protein COX14 [Saccharomycodes ludwigii]|uniref:Related to Cytochrome c oxidase assembly protein COX14 n=1 Tax=Saccharomycodes ludwigii TaxID=36035 RepID=A0A376B6C4_9ASCO|nr:hypothetical protein SCDLUD_001305 [Saccharomycodes ludwigii]KAH3903657.1 hypothetical protein SCDLUD_001305 [Saccharomycodes ludwigii]SSD60233.1 related to Cytochrome c oxidase assembly protein COX14 [Saccharomycodes ludwigii]
MAGKYAWYTRLTDTVHRLTVLSLVGFTLYMSGGLVYTMYVNGKKYEAQQLKIKEQDELNTKNEEIMKD